MVPDPRAPQPSHESQRCRDLAGGQWS